MPFKCTITYSNNVKIRHTLKNLHSTQKKTGVIRELDWTHAFSQQPAGKKKTRGGTLFLGRSLSFKQFGSSSKSSREKASTQSPNHYDYEDDDWDPDKDKAMQRVKNQTFLQLPAQTEALLTTKLSGASSSSSHHGRRKKHQRSESTKPRKNKAREKVMHRHKRKHYSTTNLRKHSRNKASSSHRRRKHSQLKRTSSVQEAKNSATQRNDRSMSVFTKPDDLI